MIRKLNDTLEQDTLTLARTLYGESEANNEADAVAIASVVLNRADHAGQWPDSIEGVCLQPWQFSCWNPNDPNRARILKASGKWFERCKVIARECINGKRPDTTNSSTHYYATYIKAPKWAKGKTPAYEVKHRITNSSHLFFNDIDTPAPKSSKQALDQIKPVAKTRTIKTAKSAVVAAGSVMAGAEAIEKAAPAIPLVSKIMDYAPWLVITILLAGIAYMAYLRYDDRQKGER